MAPSKFRPLTGGFNTRPINSPRRRKATRADLERQEAQAAVATQRRLRDEFLARDQARAR